MIVRIRRSYAVYEGEVIRPSLLSLVLRGRRPKVDDEVDVLPRRILDKPVAEGALSRDRRFRLRDREAVRRRLEHHNNLHNR